MEICIYSQAFFIELDQYHETERWLTWMDELSENDHVIIDDFLHADTYSQLQAYFYSNLESFSKAGIGALSDNVIRHDIRGDHTFWLDRQRDHFIGSFWSLVDEMIYSFNRYCFLSLSGYEFHFADYPPGARYEKHLDQFNGRNNRIITVVIYMNDGWKLGDGGELELFKGDGASLWIQPIANRCVLFKSAEIPHLVREARVNRHSLTGWLLHQPSALGKFLG
jgi:SM-20-related protein